MHGGPAGVRAAGVRPHRGLHPLQQAAGGVPHLPPVRGAGCARVPLLTAAAVLYIHPYFYEFIETNIFYWCHVI